MKTLAKAFQSVNIFNQCKSLNLPFYRCPNFLFPLMGLINISAMIGTYLIASRYSGEPEMAAIVVIVVSLIIFIIGTILIEDFKKVVQANRLKSEFVSIASHQLRSPISAISWTLDLILGGKVGEVDPRALTYLKSARASSRRITILINDLLNLKQLEEGKFRVNVKRVDVKSVVKQILTDLRAFAEANNIDLRLRVESDGDFIAKADPEEVKLIIQNLIENGIKYTTQKGFVEVVMKVDGKLMKVEVIDNGVGIPEADKSYIFQRFFRASNARVIQTEGTGLGLFMVKSIVEDMGGELGFDSKEDRGSTFWFTLPMAR